jgi:hypothetical protein
VQDAFLESSTTDDGLTGVFTHMSIRCNPGALKEVPGEVTGPLSCSGFDGTWGPRGDGNRSYLEGALKRMGLRSDNNRRQPMSETEVEAIASRAETGCSEIIILLID